MNLSQMYAAWLDSKKEEKDRDPKRLFVSDVGKCPRMVAYRMLETEMDFKAEQSKVNKTIMFDLAEHIEALLAEALKESGSLIAYQDGIDLSPRINWGGRLDIVATYNGGPRIIEVKTVHPNAFNYELDYYNHQCQAAVYDMYWWNTPEHHELPLLVYFDRGGQNTPVEQVVDYDADEIHMQMDNLEAMRDKLPELPGQMPKELHVRSYSKKIVLEPDHQCSYCDYALTCQPDMGKSVWAERDNADAPWTPKKAADPVVLAGFATKMAMEVLL
jgi:hypothetical protein